VPGSWEYQEDEDITTFLYADENNFLVFMGNSFVEKNPSEPEDVFKAFEKNALQGKVFTKSEIFEVRLADGVVAHGVEYKFWYMSAQVIWRLVYINVNKRGYTFEVFAFPSTFEARRNTIDQVFSSIRLLK
jgi:hypothetical protein